MLAVSTKSVKQTKNRFAISSDLNCHLFELHWCTKLLQRSMVDGNVFVAAAASEPEASEARQQF